MSAPVLHLAGIPVHAPLTVATNALLALECGALARSLAGRGTTVSGLWTGFFGLMAVATALGAVKHATAAPDPGSVHSAALLASNLAAGVAVALAQWATLTGLGRRPLGRSATALPALQLAVYVPVTLAVRSAAPAVLNAALGLLPVLIAEGAAARSGRPSARPLALGLSVSLGAGAVYATAPWPTRWVGPTDVAHLFMMAGLAWMAYGASQRSARVPEATP